MPTRRASSGDGRALGAAHPFVNELFARPGAVLGAPINCRNLLEADNAILVFPEGARGCGKTFDQRYKLVDFGRGLCASRFRPTHRSF